jgi:hypothetical protein
VEKRPQRRLNPKVQHKPSYRIVEEEGNRLPSITVMCALMCAYNRASRRIYKEVQVGERQLSLLCAIYWLHHAKGKNEPYAMSTLFRNYFVRFNEAKKLLGYLSQLHEKGYIISPHAGKVRGNTVQLTPLGLSLINTLHGTLRDVLQYYPEKK